MAGMNVLTDFILLLAPLPTLWRLQMPGGTKLQLMGVFCIGGLSVPFPLAPYLFSPKTPLLNKTHRLYIRRT